MPTLFEHAMAAHGAGRSGDASVLYRGVLVLDPTHALALHNLAALNFAGGNGRKALSLLEAAIKLHPDSPEILLSLSMALEHAGREDEADAARRRALCLTPTNERLLRHMAQTTWRTDRVVSARLHAALAGLLPRDPVAQANHAAGLRVRNHPAEAMAACRRALTLDPAQAEALNILGSTLRAVGRPREALSMLKQATAISPGMSSAVWNEALARLTLGDFEGGWRCYAARWSNSDFPSPRRDFSQPAWDGSDPGGRVILLHWEQGFGDTVQFVRYAPLVAARGARVVLECQPDLKRLLSGLDGVERVVASGEPLPPFDLHCALLDLPGTMGTTLGTIPCDVPYLRADPARVAHWRRRLPPGPLRVGLVWAGSPTHGDDRRRSLAFADLAPLLAVPGVVFCSLQKGRPPPAGGGRLIDLAPDLSDFAETAAALECLDLLISADTAPVHLAGALNRPCWVLLPHAADWRWLTEREDSPWYPSLRLFRQAAPGGWAGTVARAAEALARFAQARRP